MYMLMVDLSSLVIRPPFIRSRSTQLNQKPATSVTPFSQTMGAQTAVSQQILVDSARDKRWIGGGSIQHARLS
jgi:hypothetical protein